MRLKKDAGLLLDNEMPFLNMDSANRYSVGSKPQGSFGSTTPKRQSSRQYNSLIDPSLFDRLRNRYLLE
jgi:hypothetical protein